MGIFFNRLLGPNISPLPSYNSPCFIKKRPSPTASNPLLLFGPRYSPSASVSYRHTPLPFLRYNSFPISFVLPCSAVLIKPQLLLHVKYFLFRMESIRLTLVKIPLLFSCCAPNLFLTFLLSRLSFLHMPSLVCQVVNRLWQ